MLFGIRLDCLPHPAGRLRCVFLIRETRSTTFHHRSHRSFAGSSRTAL
jgi:hypothetical protein